MNDQEMTNFYFLKLTNCIYEISLAKTLKEAHKLAKDAEGYRVLLMSVSDIRIG